MVIGAGFQDRNARIAKRPFYGTVLEVEVTMSNVTVALYARVSTKDKGQDHENQLADSGSSRVSGAG